VVSEGKCYRYSNHARYQMRRRSVTEAEVVECLARKEIQYTDKKGNPIYRVRLANGRGIKVCIAKDDDEFIITVADY